MPARAVTVKAFFRRKLVTVGGVQWAPANLAARGVFATNESDLGALFQWGYADPVALPAGSAITAMTWPTGSNPCPAGWRLPTKSEFDALTLTRQWGTVNGIPGLRLTATDGASLFLPSAGYSRPRF